MQAETIELLRGKFSMEQALVLAEAIERMVEKAQFVTVSILDARIATVNARIDSVETRLIARIESVKAELIARIDSVEARLDARIDSLEAKLDAKFERWTTRIIIVMVLSQTALGPIGMRVFEAMKEVVATLGH